MTRRNDVPRPTWIYGLLLGSLVAAGSAAVHSLRHRGVPHSLLFAGLGLSLPAVAEYAAVNRTRLLRHRTYPQMRGVPVGIVLGWYAVTYPSFALQEGMLARVPARLRYILVPIGTAAAATSLDLLLDPFGLDLGAWEWTEGGPYARDVVGPNGKRGIPLSNYLGWLVLTGVVSLLYELLAPLIGGEAPPAPSPESEREAAMLLLPYLLMPGVWAVWRRKPRYLAYSLPATASLVRALRRGQRP